MAVNKEAIRNRIIAFEDLKETQILNKFCEKKLHPLAYWVVDKKDIMDEFTGDLEKFKRMSKKMRDNGTDDDNWTSQSKATQSVSVAISLTYLHMMIRQRLFSTTNRSQDRNRNQNHDSRKQLYWCAQRSTQFQRPTGYSRVAVAEWQTPKLKKISTN